MLRDRAVLDALFDDGAVLAEAGGVAGARSRGDRRAPSRELWDRDRTYVARPRRVLQARDTALVVADAGIHVLRRGRDGAWRAAISLLDLDTPTGPEDA